MITLKIGVVSDEIHCQFISPDDVGKPIFCFSLLVEPKVIRGGILLKTLGGYGEIQLPDLTANVPHDVVIAYADPDLRPVNRAWLPLGPYLRHADGTTTLSPGRAGAVPWSPPANVKAPDLALCPPPVAWSAKTEKMNLTQLNTAHQQLLSVNALSERLGLKPLVGSSGTSTNVLHETGLPQEGYCIKISADTGVTISASDDTGVFYAGISLLTLIQGHNGHIPTGEIVDAPRFEWRGQHLDCARHFYQPATILRYLDVMALMKLNRFHWHFADDEAFRLELESRPEIWQKTAFRGETETISGVFGGGPRAGGSYSKAFARELITHAKMLHIEVMPEIEVPGHSMALTKVVPGLRDPGDIGAERSVQDYVGNTMNPAMPDTWDLLDDIITEITTLFPFQYLHLGCDELATGAWSGSPAIASLKAQENLDSSDDVSGWMMERLAQKVVKLGKIPAAWEEAARGKNGGIGHNALLFSWSGQGPGFEAAKAGYDVIMTPAQHVYLDMATTGNQDDWGAAWAAFVGLEDTLNWDPTPDRLGNAKGKIKGVQGAFWSEFTTQDDQIWPMLWPRLMGVATCAWSSDTVRNKTDITALASTYGWANPGQDT